MKVYLLNALFTGPDAVAHLKNLLTCGGHHTAYEAVQDDSVLDAEECRTAIANADLVVCDLHKSPYLDGIASWEVGIAYAYRKPVIICCDESPSDCAHNFYSVQSATKVFEVCSSVPTGKKRRKPTAHERMESIALYLLTEGVKIVREAATKTEQARNPAA